MKHFKIDQYWEFSFNTQRFDTGAATDADALPTYRVYECDTDSGVNETVVQNGDCAKTDDANTTGYYHCRAQATTAAGYEAGKTYEVRIAATVNSVAGAAVVGRFAILPANVWDSLYGGTDKLDANAAELGGTSQTGNDIGAKLAGTIAAGTHNPQSGDAYGVVNSGTHGNAALKTVADAVKAKTDNLPADPADQSAVEAAITAATSVLATSANLATVAGYLDTEIAAILQDTDELQKAITDGGRTDLLIDAIKGKTDLMLDQAAIRTAVGLASANLDTQLSGISGYVDCLPATWVTVPTAAQNASQVRTELTTELGRIDATISSRGTGTALDAAGVRNAVGLASNNLDTQLSGINAKTTNLPTDPADQSAVEAAITAATSPLATAAALDTVDNFLDTEINAIKAVTDKLDTTLVLDGAVYDFTSAALAAAPSGGSSLTQEDVAQEISDALTVDTLIDGKTIQQALRIIGATTAGKMSGAGTGTEIFVGLDGSTVRVTGTVTTLGNRTGVVYG